MSLESIRRIVVYRLAIPLRGMVSHAAAERRVAEPIVVQIELINGATGYGETHPRSYVTGESSASVLEDIRQVFQPYLLSLAPESFFHALEFIDDLPLVDSSGRTLLAARAAIELALLDVYSRRFQKSITDATGWLGMGDFGPPGSMGKVRFSGVVAKRGIDECRRQIKKMRLFGLRYFKLKVGYADDIARVASACRQLARLTIKNDRTLRLDANGAWTAQQAIERLESWSSMPIASIEQPLTRGDERSLGELTQRSNVPVMHDESLVSMADAQRLHRLGIGGGFNIRLSKCGGFLPSLRLAEFAIKHGFMIQLGCMVGETSILAAAGLRFLECVPQIQFAEGCFGKFLLRQDVARPSLRFGYGGRPPRLNGLGWGIKVEPGRLEALSLERPAVLEFG